LVLLFEIKKYTMSLLNTT